MMGGLKSAKIQFIPNFACTQKMCTRKLLTPCPQQAGLPAMFTDGQAGVRTCFQK
jgi:hypothetical protein